MFQILTMYGTVGQQQNFVRSTHAEWKSYPQKQEPNKLTTNAEESSPHSRPKG